MKEWKNFLPYHNHRDYIILRLESHLKWALLRNTLEIRLNYLFCIFKKVREKSSNASFDSAKFLWVIRICCMMYLNKKRRLSCVKMSAIEMIANVWYENAKLNHQPHPPPKKKAWLMYCDKFNCNLLHLNGSISS